MDRDELMAALELAHKNKDGEAWKRVTNSSNGNATKSGLIL
jgi:hypothetical protein